MNAVLKRVVLLPNTTKQLDETALSALTATLQNAGCKIYAPDTCRSFFDDNSDTIHYLPENVLFSSADVIFVLGGDGSIIEASRRTVGMRIPIVGVNCGRLGYLAEIEMGELNLVEQVLAGGGIIEERIMLDVEILRGEDTVSFHTPALNDVALTNGPVPKLLSFDLYCNGALVEHCFADGMILSTPTGSTAYSMSAGGPILDPCMDCICATPICPQSMNHRPVIFGGSAVLEFRDMSSRENNVYLSVDGRDWTTLIKGDIVRVRRAEERTPLIRVKSGGFLSALRRKFSDTL